jgi:hypothetical protein
VLDGGRLQVNGIFSVVFTGGWPKHVILWDVEVDKGGCIKEGNVVVISFAMALAMKVSVLVR